MSSKDLVERLTALVTIEEANRFWADREAFIKRGHVVEQGTILALQSFISRRVDPPREPGWYPMLLVGVGSRLAGGRLLWWDGECWREGPGGTAVVIKPSWIGERVHIPTVAIS